MNIINQTWFYTTSSDWQDKRRGRVSRKDGEGLSRAICIQPRYASDEEWHSNAELIKSVPEMLRVLKNLVDKSYEGVITSEDREEAENILNKFDLLPEYEDDADVIDDRKNN